MESAQHVRRSPKTLFWSFGANRVFCIFFLASLPLLISGCLVVTTKHLSKPDDDSKTSVRLENTNTYIGWVYQKRFNTDDLKLDICALNGQNRDAIDFWFYVLPLPEFGYLRDSNNSILTIGIQIEPKTTNITFNSQHSFLSNVTVSNAAPKSTWRGFSPPNWGVHRGYYEIVSNAVPVTTKTWFFLEYEATDDPDIPFVLDLQGFQVDGKTISLPVMHFESATIHRPELRLPY